jgi:hypothetical protein
MGKAVEQLEVFRLAAQEWFQKEKRRLQVEESFLKKVLTARGGSVTVEDLVAEPVEQVLVDALKAYLEKQQGS